VVLVWVGGFMTRYEPIRGIAKVRLYSYGNYLLFTLQIGMGYLFEKQG